MRRLALHEPSAALWTATTATSARCWHVPPPPPALSAMPAHGAAHGLSRTLSPTAGSLGHGGGGGGGGGGGDSRTFVVGALPLVRARQSFDGGTATCHPVTSCPARAAAYSSARCCARAQQAHCHQQSNSWHPANPVPKAGPCSGLAGAHALQAVESMPAAATHGMPAHTGLYVMLHYY